MIFENLRRKIATSYIEKKGANYNPYFVNSLTNDFNFAKTSHVYMEYYNQVAPVGDSIAKIASTAATISLMPFATDEKEALKAIPNNPFSQIFRKPNFRQTGIDFKQEGFTHYLASGNNYIYLAGVLNSARDKVMGEPVAIYNFRPDCVTPIAGTDGYPMNYLYSYGGLQKSFKRGLIKDIQGNLIETFIEQDGYGVLMHFKEPSTNNCFSMMYGDSPLQSVELEINQYLQASIHNTNLLKNGMSARMLFTPKDGTTPPNTEQLQKIREYLANEYSGSNNSGKNLMIGVPFDVKPLDMNLKDMDFEKLMRRMRVAIYNKLNVPLPSVEGEFTSNTNMKEANLNFHDKAVLPLVDKYAEYLYNFVYTPFFKDEGAIKIGYDVSSIPALQSRAFENSLLIQKSGTVTINELREYQGLGRVDKGGDAVYIDANRVAVAGDEDFTDTIGIPARGSETPVEKDSLKKLLSSQVDFKGDKLYSDEDILKICDESRKD